MRKFATSEHHEDAHFIAIFEELASMFDFHLDIMLVNIRPKTYETEFLLFGFLVGIFFAFGLLIFELAVIHDTTDGWDGIGGDFDEIEPHLFGALQRVSRLHYAGLVSFFIDQANLAHADTLVDPKLFVNVHAPPTG